MLSKEQQEVVNQIDGQVLCVACPGSGKTTVLINRVKHMIESGIPSEKILVITFTKEAAMQMKDRYEKSFGKTKVCFGTIHSICFQVIKKAYGYTNANILLANEQWECIANLLKEKRKNTDDYTKNMIGAISYVRNKGIAYKKYEPEFCPKEEFIACYEAYKKYKSQNNKIDFEDMLWWVYDLFRKHDYVKEYWKAQFPYIMIDEYQDTNRLQAEIFYMLAGENGNLCVVGDDDQSCYQFRGADSSVFLDFPKQYPNAKTYHLSTNYRSGKNIVTYAGNLITHNKKRFPKEFKCHREDEGSIEIVFYDKSSPNSTTNEIENLHHSGISYDDIAVLYRINEQNQLLIGECMKKNIPFYCTEKPRDYHKEFVFRDIMAYYRLANKKEKRGDLQQILNRPQRYLKGEYFKNCSFHKQDLLGGCENYKSFQKKSSINAVNTLLEDVCILRDKTPSAFVSYLFYGMDYANFAVDHATWYGKDANTIMEILKNLTEEAGLFKTMEEWIAYADFYAIELEKRNNANDRKGLCMSTLHSAKGLEWKNVIIADVEDGIYPYKKAKTDEELEEERRLFYVGLTRAKDRCVLVTSKKNPSDYIKEAGKNNYI